MTEPVRDADYAATETLSNEAQMTSHRLPDVRYHAQCHCGWQGLFEETAEAAQAQALEHDGTAHTIVVEEIRFAHEAGEDGRCIWCGSTFDGQREEPWASVTAEARLWLFTTAEGAK